MKLRILSGLILIFVSFVSSAEGTGGYKKLSWVSVENGDIYIQANPAFDLSSCGSEGQSTNIIKIQKGSDGFELMYSMVLAAYTSGQNIRFFVNGCGSSPWGNSVSLVYSSQLGLQ